MPTKRSLTPAVQEDCRAGEKGREVSYTHIEMRQGDKQHLHGVDLVDLGAVDDGHKVAVQDRNGGGNRKESGNDNCCAEHVSAITLRYCWHHVLKPTQISLLALAHQLLCIFTRQLQRDREAERAEVCTHTSRKRCVSRSWNPRARSCPLEVCFTQLQSSSELYG